MKNSLLILLLCFATSVSADSFINAGKEWLKIIDNGNYSKSWQEADAFFKAQLPQQKWDAALKGVRTPLGDVKSREVLRHKKYHSLPNMPEGNYLVIQYKTDFSNKSAATETLTLSKSSGQWRAIGYFIK